MTREGAIKRLKGMKWTAKKQTCEALDMAIEALEQITGKLKNPDDSLLTADSEAYKEQKSKLDLISGAEAIEALKREQIAYDEGYQQGRFDEKVEAEMLVSFEKDTETKSYSKDSGDLIIKGAEGIKDGLYVIKDGTLFKYKEKGGTVRVYTIADRPKGEWVEEEEYGDLWVCDQCGFASEHNDDFCPNCGADMRGE